MFQNFSSVIARIKNNESIIFEQQNRIFYIDAHYDFVEAAWYSSYGFDS